MTRPAIIAIVLVVAACAVAASEPAGAPCFPDRRTIPASDYRLRRFAAWVDDDGKTRGASGRFGTCTVRNGVVRTADGVRVAGLGCGIEVKVPGMVDDHGHGIGSRGRAVLRSHGSAATTLVCQDAWVGRPRTICWVPTDDDSGDFMAWRYIVAASLPDRCPNRPTGDADRPRWCDDPMQGDEAIEFFAPRRVVGLQNRGSCH